MDINELTLIGIKNYYNVLKSNGFLSYNQVYQLLLLSFIDDLFQDDFSWYITEEDYALLTSIITCISKHSCIVPYIKTAIHVEPIKNYLEDNPIRVSEKDIIKLAEADILRLTNI